MSVRNQWLFNRLTPVGALMLYAGFTLLWIASSDWLLTLIVRQPGALSYVGSAKGFLFVALSAGFLFLLLRSGRSAAGTSETADAQPGRRRLLLVFAGLAVSVPLIDSGLIYQRGEALEQATYADLRAVAGLKQAEVEQWLAERREDGEALAADQGFARQVAQLLAYQEPTVREDVRSRLDAFRLRRDYQGALLLDPHGRSILGGEDAPAQDRGPISESLESGRVMATPLYYDSSGRLRLDWVVPVLPADGRRDHLATVVLTLEPGVLFGLIQAWPTASPSGEVMLVRRDGDSVVLLNALRYRSSAIPILPLGKLETDSPSLVAASAAQAGVVAGRDYRGVSVLTAWQPIAGTDWRVVAKIDRDEVVAPLRRFLMQVTLVALLTLAVVASIVLFSLHQRRRAEEALRSSEAALNRAQVVGQLGSWAFDAKTSQLTWSAECYRIFGIAPGTPLTYQTFLDCVHPQDREYVDLKWKEAEQGALYDIEHRIVVGDYVKWVRERAELRLGPDGELLGGIGTVQDVTQRKNAEAELEFMADHDPLTRLANRRLMLSRLQHALDLARRRGERLALFMLDLDRFKDVNDSFGHMAGDELLIQVAAELTACQRGSDTVARLGGDEFTVLLEGLTSPEDAARIAEKIVCTLNRPWRLSNGIEVRVGASVGIALYPEHGQTAEVLLQHVDAALYRAKEEGRGCVRYFTNDLTEAARNRVELAARLRRAIAQRELQLYYQPQVDVVSGAIVGAEALVRWHDPDGGWVSPGRFIAVAEETGIMGEIGAWVLTETCRQGAQWIRDGLPPVVLSVNFSPYQFRHSDIGTTLARVLAQTGFPPERLELELTESALMARVEEVEATLRRLRGQGVRLAIDDFGTGYSSFAHLKRFPIDVLKIDKSFTDEIPYNRDSREIAAAIVAMAHVLGMEVVAEGVETAEQLAFLRSKGCNRYQGFLMSPAIPADAFATWLAASSLRSATGAS